MKPGDEYEFEKPIAHSPHIYEAAQNITQALSTLGFEFTSATANTPLRIAKYWAWLLEKPEPIKWTKFDVGDTDQMVVVESIQFESACEHHLLPFLGRAHIAYLPNKEKIIGLSKLARVVQNLAKAPQTQEYLTSKIAKTLNKKLKPEGVIVYIEATHTCMTARGAKAFGSVTHTSKLMGVFQKDRAAKEEFFNIIRSGKH